MSAAFIIASYSAVALGCFVLGYFTASVLGTLEEHELGDNLHNIYAQGELGQENATLPEKDNPQP